MNLGGVHLITDRALCPFDRLHVVVERAIQGGVAAIHLRDRDVPARDLARLATSLRDVIAGRALLFVNDRVDVALASGVDGVQLGEVSLPIADARRVSGRRLLLGRSVHSLDGARQAAADGADFVVLGTIFASRSHPGQPGAGVALVRTVRDAVRIPLIGIGGIDHLNAGEVIRAGADGVAVISAILGSDDVLAAAQRVVAAVERGAGHTASAARRGTGNVTINVTVNGKPRSLPEPMTVARFLETLNINPLAVAVELRGDALPREQFAKMTIEDGDSMEVVRMMGGG